MIINNNNNNDNNEFFLGYTLEDEDKLLEKS